MKCYTIILRKTRADVMTFFFLTILRMNNSCLSGAEMVL